MTCSATPVQIGGSGDDDESDDDTGGTALLVEYTAEDNSGEVTAVGFIEAGCGMIDIESGQLVVLPCLSLGDDSGDDDDGDSIVGPGKRGRVGVLEAASTPQTLIGGDDDDDDDDDGGPTPCFVIVGDVLFINAPSATLHATATDAAGNESSCSLDLCPPGGGGGDDDDDD